MLKCLLSLAGQDCVILIYSNHIYRTVPLSLLPCLTKANQKSPPEVK